MMFLTVQEAASQAAEMPPGMYPLILGGIGLLLSVVIGIFWFADQADTGGDRAVMVFPSLPPRKWTLRRKLFLWVYLPFQLLGVLLMFLV